MLYLKRYNHYLILILLMLNCTSIRFAGKYFNVVDLEGFKLGITTKEQTKDLLGSPFREETILDSDNVYDHYIYFYSKSKKENHNDKLLVLEFKNDRLNAYMKRFNDNEVGIENLKYFENNIYNKSNLIEPFKSYKKDITKYFGNPPVKGYCDSKIKAFKEICSDNLSEVWIYFNYSDEKTRNLFIGFNSEDQVITCDKKVE